MQSVSAIVLSTLVGGFFTLSVELPIASIVKMLTSELLPDEKDVTNLRDLQGSSPMEQNRNMQ